MRLLRVVGLLLLGLLALTVVAYVARGVVGTFPIARAKAEARADAEKGLPRAVEQSRRDRLAVRSALDDLGAPSYSFSELSCDLGTNDSGWIVDEYTQECAVRSVDLYAVDHGPRRCESVPLDADVTADVEAPGFAAVERGRTTSLVMAEPYYRMCPDGIVRPSAFGASRLLDGTRPRTLQSSPAWVVAVTSTPVSDSVLGCSPWGIIFCTKPVDRPVLPSG